MQLITSMVVITATFSVLLHGDATGDGSLQPKVHSGIDTCEAVVGQPGRTGVELRNLVGEFNISMRVTNNTQRKPLVRGRMILKRWSASTSGLDTAPVSWELWGWTTIPFDQIGDIPFGLAPSSSDPRRPGILGIWDDGDRIIRLNIGTYLPNGGTYLHSGVTLDVHATDSSGFHGEWAGPTYPSATPSGYFCASRIDSVGLSQ